MSVHLSTRQLELYLRRALSPAELLAADDHLAGCETCRRRAGEDESVAPLFESVRDEFEAAAGGEGGHLTFDLLADYVDRNLGAEERLEAERHLSVCPPCAGEARELETFRQAVTRTAIEAPAALPRPASRLWGAAFWQTSGFWTPARTAAAASLALLLVGVFSLLIWRGARPSPNEITDQRRPTPDAAASPSPAGTPAEVATNPGGVTPEGVPSPTPLPTPAQGPSSPQAALALNDGGGLITLDEHGRMSGLEALPPQHRQAVRAALADGRVELPAGIAGLAGKAGRLLGGGGEGVSFALVQPVGTAVLTDHPRFSWRPLDGATSYTVNVYDSEFNRVAGSPPLSSTEWTIPRALEGGKTYSWHVVAVKGGEEVTSPTPPAPEAKFRVPTRAKLDEVRRVERLSAGSHLALGVLFLREGLFDDAVREFRALVASNPDSPVARRLLGQAQDVRR